ncbi:MAG TPA: DNA polymerase III subunit alpha, partial [Trueperaceae bacterium]|nr:DNA polymerase III subunit alpha [Trueperaceae bacterium]
MPDGRAPAFAHLHQHTAYSLLDGAARIKDLVEWVRQVTPGDAAVAMTDHGNMHGAVEFYKAAEAQGVKPILGLEAYVTSGSRFEKRRMGGNLDGGYFHLTLLAKNFTGYQNLCRLSSRAYLEGFYMKPRVDHELLAEHSEGVIALSGCLGAQIPRTILDIGEGAGERMLEAYLAIYGDDFFVELQNHGLEEQRRLNPVLKDLAQRHGLGMVATNDGHYVRKDDARAHEALLSIQTKTVLSDPNRFRFPCDEFYVKTPEEMASALPESEYPGALSNSLTVADMCDVQLPIGDKRVYQMPELPLPEGRTLAQQLRIDSYRGLMQRYPEVDEALLRAYLAQALDAAEVRRLDLEGVLVALAEEGERGRRKKGEGETYDRYAYPHLDAFRDALAGAEGGTGSAFAALERAEYELGVIVAMGFPDYFLIVADFINWAKDHAIAVGPGRGSGAGSIVAYALRITNIDPMAFGLLFERFLNPERISMPDFDIDFSDVRRGEVIDYVRSKYGDDKVAHIATFGTMASRAAIKDAARVMEAPFSDADKISKLVPVVYGRSVSIERAREEVPEFRELYDAGAKEYVDVAQTLEGLTRHASVHAAGVIISRNPVQELAPVFRAGDGPVVCQYDMGSVEDLGFIKMDFLGLRTLSFIEAAVKIVREAHGVELDPDAFAQDDAATFEMLARGESAGVFQFESPGMVDTLKKLKPHRIHDLIAVNALYRP